MNQRKIHVIEVAILVTKTSQDTQSWYFIKYEKFAAIIGKYL